MVVVMVMSWRGQPQYDDQYTRLQKNTCEPAPLGHSLWMRIVIEVTKI